jgi:predicted DNA binding CopG/RHH family protein
MKRIHSLAEIPRFETEAEEVEFWETHCLGDELLAQMGPIPEDEVPIRRRTRPIAVRFDEDIIGRMKTLAARKGKGYQSLLKEFVVERLHEEEKREGIV